MVFFRTKVNKKCQKLEIWGQYHQHFSTNTLVGARHLIINYSIQFHPQNYAPTLLVDVDKHVDEIDPCVYLQLLHPQIPKVQKAS